MPRKATVDSLKGRLNRLDAERNACSRKHVALLNARTPEEWEEKIIEACPDLKLRAQVARIVAFDFGHDNTAEWAARFDKYMTPNTLLYGIRVATALEEVGYTKTKAHLRSYPGNSRPVEETDEDDEIYS